MRNQQIAFMRNPTHGESRAPDRGVEIELATVIRHGGVGGFPRQFQQQVTQRLVSLTKRARQRANGQIVRFT